jgi:mevalonate kinase
MIQLPQKVAVGSAHGKLILVGEHAVVYDRPAIAIPFPLIKVKATIEEIYGSIRIESEFFHGPIHSLPEKLQGIAICILETLTALNKPRTGLLIRLRSTIPLGRGLGSSAAIAIALVRSLYTFYGGEVRQTELMALVHLAELHAHGNPSGIDMAAVSSECPILFQKGKSPNPLQIGAPLHLVVADSGRIGDTHAAVTSVRERYILNPARIQASLDRIGWIAKDSRAALSLGNMELLGKLLNFAQDELIELGVSDKGINKLIDVARKAGAMGAKLTGGGRGGCVLAIASSQAHSKVLANAFLKVGALQTWNFSLEGMR